MQKIEAVNDFVVKFANINGSGSASANELFARAILRMGVPVSPRNIFPSNIQGLPTWFEVRVTEHGYLGRRGGVDMMVAMNPQTWDQDVREIDPGGYLFYDSSKAAAAREVPRRHPRPRHAAHRDLQRPLQRLAPAPVVQEHHLRRRPDDAARHRPGRDREALR
jgi:Pyruvate/2-oxoacid:ferredoxin oxidoreductase gamma subunit